MWHRARAALAAVALLCLVGCAATGPKGSDVAGSLGAVPAGFGRIVFFRSKSIVGAAVQPDIRLDGQVVGESRPGGFFWVDAPPGKHVVSVSTEASTTLEIQVFAGQTHYVRSAIGMGLVVGRVALTVEGQVTARSELPALSYTGAAPVRLGGAGLAPYAAASAPSVARGPALKVGDRLVYRVTDRLTGLTHDAVYVVDQVDADRIQFNQGGRVEGVDGTVLSVSAPIAGTMDRCTPPGGWARATMTLGMVWTADVNRSPGSSCSGQLSLSARVVSEEPMATPMGELTVQRIDFEGNLLQTGRLTVSYQVAARAWYSPRLARIVRFESELTGGGRAPDRELVELIDERSR